ncbi:hypothetical protein L208DRAFT_1341630 [Tricholoma matsutake]|nr:hypothetical protein L208DRAFT_1341630 [Tricholoma matsutake 945]
MKLSQLHLAINAGFLLIFKTIYSHSQHHFHTCLNIISPPPVFYSPTPSPQSPLQPEENPEPIIYETEANKFGMYHMYTSYPTCDPDNEQDLDDLCDSPGLAIALQPQMKWWSGLGQIGHATRDHIYAPFLNSTIFRLMDWFYSGLNMKSMGQLDALVNNVILADDFDVTHLMNFNVTCELKCLDVDDPQSSTFAEENGWMQASVKIRLPAERVRNVSEDHAPEFKVKGVYHRSLLEVIKTAFQDISAKSFHYTPFQLWWKPTPNSAPEHIITELYNSDAFLWEHEKIQTQLHDPGCELETCIAVIMLWSDSTHLTNFGTTSLWPIYGFFWNQSKYSHSKPMSFAAHHITYIPSVCLLLSKFV